MIEKLRNQLSQLPLHTKLMLGVLLIALVLRVWGIWFGLPFIYHNDEGNEVIRALQLASGSFDFSRVSKGGYFYVLFVEYGFLFAAMYLGGLVKTANDFAIYFIQDPSAFYLLGRATTAILGTATVYLAYRITLMTFTPRAAVFSAAFVAFNILHAQLSHYITVDVPMVFLSMGSLLFALRIQRSGSTKDYIFAALLAAMATATKITAILLLPSLVIAHIFWISSSGAGTKGYLLDRRLLLAAVVFTVSYLALSPGFIVNFVPLMSHIFRIFGLGSETIAVSEASVMTMSQETNLVLFYASKIAQSTTLPVFLIFCGGLGYALWKRTSTDYILLVFGIATFVFMAMSSDQQLFFPRYVLACIPVFAILAGRWLDSLLAYAPAKHAPAISLAVFIALSIAPVYAIASNNHLAVQKDTRTFAKEWFDRAVPAGSKVFIEGFEGHLYQGTVPLNFSKENLSLILDSHKGTDKGKARYFQLAIKANRGKTFDLYSVSPAELQPLDYYKANEVEYFVIRPDRYSNSRMRRDWSQLLVELANDPDLVVIERFAPEDEKTPGPLIEVYRNLGVGPATNVSDN